MPMTLKNLPIDYGQPFNNLLLRRAVEKWPAGETAEIRYGKVIHEAMFTCTNCKLQSYVHIDKKCPFDTTNFAALLEDVPGPLMRAWVIEFLHSPPHGRDLRISDLETGQ